jgi:hypothetical protein
MNALRFCLTMAVTLMFVATGFADEKPSDDAKQSLVVGTVKSYDEDTGTLVIELTALPDEKGQPTKEQPKTVTVMLPDDVKVKLVGGSSKGLNGKFSPGQFVVTKPKPFQGKQRSDQITIIQQKPSPDNGGGSDQVYRLQGRIIAVQILPMNTYHRVMFAPMRMVGYGNAYRVYVPKGLIVQNPGSGPIDLLTFSDIVGEDGIDVVIEYYLDKDSDPIALSITTLDAIMID